MSGGENAFAQVIEDNYATDTTEPGERLSRAALPTFANLIGTQAGAPTCDYNPESARTVERADTCRSADRGPWGRRRNQLEPLRRAPSRPQVSTNSYQIAMAFRPREIPSSITS
jgi:hypothetical protein